MQIINLLLATTLLFTACNNKPMTKDQPAMAENVKEDTARPIVTKDTTKIPMPGSDRDDHGCIASAGYTWSVVKNKCIRIWEAGTKLHPTDAVADKTTSAFVVFDNAEFKAEVYIPHQPGSVILEYGKKNSEIWFNDDWKLERTEKGLALKKDSAVLYAEQTFK